MSKRRISLDTRNATSLRESGGGHTRYGLLDGPILDQSGLEVAHANRFLARHGDVVSANQIASGISGLKSTGCSLQVRLMLSLVSKLPKLKCGLSTSAMTWKPWVTKSGRPFSRLAVSGQIMRDIGFTLSATPTATANQNAPSMAKWPGCRGIQVTPERWRNRMGYPIAWDVCADTVMPLSRK